MINIEPPPHGSSVIDLNQWFYSVYRVFTQRIADLLMLSTTTFSNAAGSGDTDMATYTLSPESLFANGQFLTIEGFGTFAANGNTKRIRIVFGSTTVFDTGNVTDNSGAWKITLNLFRTAASVQKYEGCYFSNGGGQSLSYGTGTENFSVANTVKFVGNGLSVSDVVQEGMTIKWNPVA